MSQLPNVVIFGRANVGKSTLFNRLIGEKKALTSPIAGTTRDIKTGICSWLGYDFNLIDTGGIEKITPTKKLKNLTPAANEQFAQEIIKKTQTEIKKAAVIIFVVDVKDGLTLIDKELSKDLKILLRDINKNIPVILVANKGTSYTDRLKGAEFYQLALGEVYPTNAVNGSGTGDLLDAVIAALKKTKKIKMAKAIPAAKPLKIAMVGRPNVGKSSILNSILGEERVIVSPIAHTTREPNDIIFEYEGKRYQLIDTAGIRRRSKIEPGLEKLSVEKSLNAIKKAQVCLLILDVSEPITDQDRTLSEQILDAQTSLIIVANKWDLLPEKDTQKFTKYIYGNFPYLTYAPVIFVSAKQNLRTKRLLAMADEIYADRIKEISKSELDHLLKISLKRHAPLADKGTVRPFIYEIRQTQSNPPQFEILIGHRHTLQANYPKYIENQIREKYKFYGTPISIKVINR